MRRSIGVDVMRQHRGFMLWIFADRQQAAVDFWMQGFDAAIHQLGEAGEVGDVADGEPGIAKRLVRPPCRDEFKSQELRGRARNQ